MSFRPSPQNIEGFRIIPCLCSGETTAPICSWVHPNTIPSLPWTYNGILSLSMQDILGIMVQWLVLLYFNLCKELEIFKIFKQLSQAIGLPEKNYPKRFFGMYRPINRRGSRSRGEATVRCIPTIDGGGKTDSTRRDTPSLWNEGRSWVWWMNEQWTL